MRVSFVDDFGNPLTTVDIDPGMELENVMALLEAESGIPVSEQSISFDGRELPNPESTMSALGVTDGALLTLRRKVSNATGGRQVPQDAETLRLQVLSDPAMMRQLQETSPELATAAQSNPGRFAELVREISERSRELEIARQREIQRLNADPFNIEAQRKIEEAIREQAVLENRAHALEWSPEAFARVTMLYVEVEVNSHPVKAFVDSGAQTTIMSPDCAEACGITRLIDTAFAGIAKGVGTAKILGRVHSAPLKVADLYLPCSFTVMEGRDVDLLLGLDMLKAHQACIDLEKNVLRIQGREIKFLAEHELHDKARMMNSGEHADSLLDSNEPSSSSSAMLGGAPSAFPGSGQTLGAAPRAGGVGASSYPEEAIQTLLGLGLTRDEAIRSLELAGGNVDVAASLFF